MQSVTTSAHIPLASIVATPQAFVPAEGRGPLYTARLALDDRSARDVYRLRYESYLQSGHIDPNPAGLFRDRYDDQPNCRSIIVYSGADPVASVRTCALAHQAGLTSPAMDSYPEEVEALLGPDATVGLGGRALEITRLVRSPAASNNQGLVFLLYRLAGYVGIMDGTQVILACVRKNHAPFYKRIGYREITEPRPYPGLKCPMQLLACSRAEYERVRAGFPVLDPYAGRNSDLDSFLHGGTVSLTLL
jgi:hypothetical protein